MSGILYVKSPLYRSTISVVVTGSKLVNSSWPGPEVSAKARMGIRHCATRFNATYAAITRNTFFLRIGERKFMSSEIYLWNLFKSGRRKIKVKRAGAEYIVFNE